VIRIEICDYGETNVAFRNQINQEAIMDDEGGDLDGMLRLMRETNAWGGNIPLQIYSDKHKVMIICWDNRNPNSPMRIVPMHGKLAAKR
jgi:hypothetical protein